MAYPFWIIRIRFELDNLHHYKEHCTKLLSRSQPPAIIQSEYLSEEDYNMREAKYKDYSDLPLTLTVPEVGEALGISRAAAYQLVRSKGFPHIKIGTRILVPKDRFLAWIDEQVEVEQ